MVVDHFPPGLHDQEMWLDCALSDHSPRPVRYGWTCQELPPTGIAQGVIGVHMPPYHDKVTVHKEVRVLLAPSNPKNIYAQYIIFSTNVEVITSSSAVLSWSKANDTTWSGGPLLLRRVDSSRRGDMEEGRADITIRWQ